MGPIMDYKDSDSCVIATLFLNFSNENQHLVADLLSIYSLGDIPNWALKHLVK